MKTDFKLVSLLIISAIIILLSACGNSRSKDKSQVRDLPGLNVELEEIVYEYENPDNGSGPFWCHGNAILVRDGDNVIVSGIETLKQYKPLNNIRWLLYKRDLNGWKLQQADEKDRTREPSPIGLLSNGSLLMSVNPTIEADPEKYSTRNQPQILEFSLNNLKASYKTLLPEWNGDPSFTEHSYRTFSVDRENNEFIVFQNIGYTHSEWAFFDRDKKWHSGQLPWEEMIDPTIEPYNSKHIRVTYPLVVLKDKELHFVGNCALNKWSRIQNMEDAKRIGLDDIVSAGGMRIAGGRFRRLYYTWTPDITKEEFSSYIEIANSHENGENLRVLDMWLDPESVANVIWLSNPINKEIRDKYFPDIKRKWSLNFAKIKKGEILMNKILLETGEGVQKDLINDNIENCSISWGRFHILPNNRLFVIFHIAGTKQDNTKVDENLLMELFADGSVSMPHIIPMKNPMSFFFTATPRGGSLPSETIDIIGRGNSDTNLVRYARIKLNE